MIDDMKKENMIILVPPITNNTGIINIIKKDTKTSYLNAKFGFFAF